MCIGVWTLSHPNYALILCTNRDEFLDRPTQNAHFHSFEDENDCLQRSSSSGSVLSGRDIQAGGSWLGISRTGRVALLTNITEPLKKLSSSRGYLVSSFLLSDSSHPLEDQIGKIVPQDAKFAGFNLLLLAPTPLPQSRVQMESEEDKEVQEPEPEPEPETKSATASGILRDKKLMYDAILVTNHGACGALQTRRLTSAERTCGCVSNGIDGQGGNEWPKVKRARSDLGGVLNSLPIDGYSFAQTEVVLIEHLFNILTWQSPNPVTQRNELRNTVHVAPLLRHVLFPSMTKGPKTSQADGLSASASAPLPTHSNGSDPQPQNAHRASSGSEPYYGTRLSTVLLVRNDGSVLFIERDVWRLDNDGRPKRMDKQECRGESDIKQRVFEFNLPSVTLS